MFLHLAFLFFSLSFLLQLCSIDFLCINSLSMAFGFVLCIYIHSFFHFLDHVVVSILMSLLSVIPVFFLVYVTHTHSYTRQKHGLIKLLYTSYKMRSYKMRLRKSKRKPNRVSYSSRLGFVCVRFDNVSIGIQRPK